MTVSGSLRWCAVGILAAGFVLASGSPPEPQKKNPKELMKEAQTDEQNDRWEAALEKLQNAAAQRPKDKAIAQALKQAQEQLSDRAATKAMASCNELKLDMCEKQVRLALSYMRSQRAVEVDNQLAAHKAQLQKRWDQAEQMIGSGQLDEANAELESLSQHSYLFPTLSAEKERLRTLRLGAAMALGTKDVSEQQFDAATQAFGTALRLDPGNAEATRGIKTAEKGKEAFSSYQQAKDAFKAKKYEVAYLSNQKSLGLFPERQEYQDLDKQISAQWLEVLEDEHALNPKGDDLKGNQKAWESLEWIRHLDPHYKELEEATRRINTNLYADYIQKANEYQSLPNNSGIGVAYLYYVNAQLRNPNPGGEHPLAASFSAVSELFTRKRHMLVLVSVRNLSPVSPGFSEVVDRRLRGPIEGQGLRDLKLSSLEKYQDNPAAVEDPLFQDKRPDGKSPIAWFDVDITNYETESIGNDKPEDKHSRFKSGQESVPNPEYAKLVEQDRRVANALSRKHKPGKPTKEGYTTNDLVILEKALGQTPPNITQEKDVEYTYQEYHLNNGAHITMRLEFRDMLEKQLIGSDEVDITRQDKATEIAGVQEADVNGLINRPARMKSPEQLLREAELDALKALDAKVPALLSKYTQRYYNEGEKALSEGRPADALENFVCYWQTFRGQTDEKRWQHIREVVKLYTGFALNAPGSLSGSP